MDPERVARDLGFARQRIDFGLHQRERRQQRCPEVELPGGVTGEVEFSALLGERDQPRPCIAKLLMMHAMVGEIGIERRRDVALRGLAVEARTRRFAGSRRAFRVLPLLARNSAVSGPSVYVQWDLG